MLAATSSSEMTEWFAYLRLIDEANSLDDEPAGARMTVEDHRRLVGDR